MISILIPVYNYDVTTLVEELHRQAFQLNADFEIFIFDDGSHSALNKNNKKLNKLKNVQFHCLTENVGLSENRNLLARAANYENLLFIDGDSKVKKKFLQNYYDAIDDFSEVIYGGRIHPKNYPDKSNLRWKYGTYVEDKTAKDRMKFPYRSTLFNNTLIKKKLFEKIYFEKNLTKYGHEDTLFSYELKKRKASIKHIQNPVIHGDIDSNEVFLKKFTSGLNNLNFLYKKNMIDPKYVKILTVYSSLKKLGLTGILGWCYSVFKKPIRRNLTSERPSLFVFHIYRLTYFCKIAK